MKCNQDIKSRGIESVVLNAPFADALSQLRSKKYKIISLAQNSNLRIQYGKEHDVSEHGNWVREAILYIPSGENRLVRNSPILKFAEEATKLDRQGKEFYPTEKQIERALRDSIEYPKESIEIPTNRLDSEALTVWTFEGEDNARNYGEFLIESGIKKMPISAVNKEYVNKQKKPFVRQIWFRNLNQSSELDGSLKNLFITNRMRGIRNKK